MNQVIMYWLLWFFENEWGNYVLTAMILENEWGNYVLNAMILENEWGNYVLTAMIFWKWMK